MENEVSFSNKYSLMASINHPGALDQGHYWVVIKDLNSRGWLSFNDKVVLTVPQYSLNNSTSYTFFYISFFVNFLKGDFVFLNIIFAYDNHPLYYPSSGRGIEFAHSIFRYLHLCETLVFMRSITRGLTNLA